MAFRKFQSVEKVSVVHKDDSEQIRKVVKEAGVKSASQLTEDQRDLLRKT